MRYFFIAGEASGDLHASNLIKELHKQDGQAEIVGLGGELMEAAGMKLLRHYREMAFMGFIPVIKNLSQVKRNFDLCREQIKASMPDVLILIDYPSFNLRMGEYARSLGIKVYYYISPKVWVWKKGRIKKIKQVVDEMFTIFPFETAFFAKHDMAVNYVGNPVMDAVLARKTKQTLAEFKAVNQLNEKPILVLVPGSRLQEVKSLLPLMLQASSDISTHQVVITAAPNIEEEVYEEIIGEYAAILVHQQTYETLQMADLAAVASGTVTLEAAVLECPQVVCYKMGGGMPLYYMGKWFAGIRFVSLVNIILKRMAVPELLQHFCTSQNINRELKQIISSKSRREQIMNDYQLLAKELGGGGASQKAAQIMVTKLRETL